MLLYAEHVFEAKNLKCICRKQNESGIKETFYLNIEPFCD
jgi:hypothetical protein